MSVVTSRRRGLGLTVARSILGDSWRLEGRGVGILSWGFQEEKTDHKLQQSAQGWGGGIAKMQIWMCRQEGRWSLGRAWSYQKFGNP